MTVCTTTKEVSRRTMDEYSGTTDCTPYIRGRPKTKTVSRKRPCNRSSSSNSSSYSPTPRTSSSSSTSSSFSPPRSRPQHSHRHMKKRKRTQKGHKKQRKPQHRRHQSTTSGESSVDDSNHKQPNISMPPISYGGKTGDNVNTSIVKKIRKDAYVNFADLIPNLSSNNNITDDNLYINIGEGNGPKLMTRKNNSLLSYTGWSEAYDTFMMTYIQEQGLKRANDVCGLLKDMLTYRNHVTTMMREGGGEWRGYDQHFRKLMENQKVSWATANFNLIWHYNNKTLANHSSRTKFTRTNNNYKQGSVCKQFNTPHTRCPNSKMSCNYGHFCTRCGDNTHPYYLCQNRTDRATASTQLYRSARATGVSKYSSRINRGPTLMSKQTTIKDTVKNQ